MEVENKEYFIPKGKGGKKYSQTPNGKKTSWREKSL